MPSEVRFAEVKKLLEKHGYHLERVRGSHHVFVKPGSVQVITIPVHHNKVPFIYVRKAEKIVQAENRGAAGGSTV